MPSPVQVATSAVVMYLECLTLVLINWTIIYYYMRDDDRLCKRRPKILLFAACVGIFQLGVVMPLVLSFSQSSCCKEPFPYWRYPFSIFAHFASVVMFSFTYMAHLQWFELGWNQALEDLQWRLHINSKDNTNWFIRKKKTFGNKKYLRIYCCFVIGLGALVSFVGVHLGGGQFNVISRLGYAIGGVVPTIHCAILLCKLPRYKDFWDIRDDVKYLCISLFVGYVSYLSYGIIVGPESPSVQYAVFAALTGSAIFWTYSTTLGRTLWRLQAPVWCWQAAQRKSEADTRPRLTSQTSVLSMTKTSTGRSANGIQYEIRDVLSSKNGLSLFCRHMAREFSVENILFLMESQRFVENLLLKCETERNLLLIQFAKNCPISEIVNNDLHNSYEQAVLLFEKYIPLAKEFSINISGPVKLGLSEFFHYMPSRGMYIYDNEKYVGTKQAIEILAKSRSEQELLEVFEAARRAVWELISRDSFSRFCKTDEYKRWAQFV